MAPAGLVSSETSLLGRPDAASPCALSSEHRVCCLCLYLHGLFLKDICHIG